MKENQSSEQKKSRLKQDFFVIRQLSSKEIKRGNASKNLGQLWNVVTPIVSMITLTIIFATVFKHDDVGSFATFVFTGTILFGFYDKGMGSAMGALSGNKSLLIRTKIPKNLLVIEKVYVAFIYMLFSLVGYVIVIIFTRTPVGPTAFLALVVGALSFIIILGIGKILAVINVYFADISYLYRVAMRLVFYGSGIFYSASRLSPVMQQIVSFNPIYLSISFARSCILYNEIPAADVWIKLIIYAAGFYIAGTLIFNKGSQDVVAKL